MFSFFGNSSPASVFKEQQKELVNVLQGDFDSSNSFLSSVSEIAEIDTKIQNMYDFVQKKIKFIDTLPIGEYKKVNDSEHLRFYLALGLIETSSPDNDKINHLRMNNMRTATFKRNMQMNDMRTFLYEYSSKLKDLKAVTLISYQLPENTGYQLELRNKLSKLLNKTKYYILDIYLNHYIQYVYLLFAINVYKTTEKFFKFNAEHQKQLALLAKTDQLLNARTHLLESDKSNMQKIYTMITSLISQTNDVSTFNKPSDQELNNLNNAIKQSGGDVTIKTIADDTIQRILSKHLHFHELYKETRNAMPMYFQKINELVVSKIHYLKELKNVIMVLEPKHVALFQKTEGLLSKLMDSKDLGKHNGDNNEIVQKTIETKLNNITQNIENTVNENVEFAENIQKENDQMTNALNANRSNMIGGFIRSGTRAPSVSKCNR